MGVSDTKSGTDEQCGTLAIMYRNADDPSSEVMTEKFHDSTNISRRMFRGKTITRVEVWGNCTCHLFPTKDFEGEPLAKLPCGFADGIQFVPKSISKIEP